MQVLITDVWAGHNLLDRVCLHNLRAGLRTRWPDCRFCVVAARAEGFPAAADPEVVADLLAIDPSGLERQMGAADGVRTQHLRQAFETSDLVISAGGLFDPLPVTVRHEFPLLSRLLHLEWALDRRIPVALPGLALEMIGDGAARMAVRGCLARVGHVSAADRRSLEQLQETGTAPQATLGAPPCAWTVAAEPFSDRRAADRGSLVDGALVIVVGGLAKRLPADLFATGELIDDVLAAHDLPVVVVGENRPGADDPDARRQERSLVNDDLLAMQALFGLVKDRERLRLCPPDVPAELLLDLFARSRAVVGVGSRLVMSALAAGGRCASLSGSVPVEAFFSDLGLEDLCLSAVDQDALSRFRMLDRLLSGDDGLVRRLERARGSLAARVESDWRRIERLAAMVGHCVAAAPRARGGHTEPVATKTTVTTRTPEASVIIPAYNRLDLLEPVLEGFARETARIDCEVVVVDDGSDPPVRRLFESIAPPPALRLVERAHNGGRGAALNSGVQEARGRIVIFCDSDIAPEEGFVAEHIAFHEQNPALRATHLGALEWGIEPGFLGWHLGARCNPKMRELRGDVPWQTWFTDNWSFKPALFRDNEIRFDEAFKVWGWEELDVALKLRDLGVTNRATGTARGRHLRPVEPESYCRNFRRGVPNLLYLADLHREEAAVQSWLGNRFNDPRVLAACENLVQSLWTRCLELDTKDRGLMRRIEDPLVGQLGDALMTSFFRISVARGFMDLQAPAAVPLPEVDDAESAVPFAYLTTLVYLIGLRIDPRARCEEILLRQIERLLGDGRFAADMEDRFVDAMQYWTAELARICKTDGMPLVG